MSQPNASAAPTRRRRRWTILVGMTSLLLISLVALYVSLPAWLSSAAGNRAIFARLDRAFAPGRLRLESVRVSWRGSTRLAGFRLDDPRGKTVLTAPTATLSATLWDLVARPGRLGTLFLEGATFDVDRGEDGQIDLAEALGTVVANPDPRRDLNIGAEGATLAVHDRGSKLLDGRMTLLLKLPPSPTPASWTMTVEGDADHSFQVVGELDRWRSRPTSRSVPDLNATIRVGRWPMPRRIADVDLAADLGGRVAIERTDAIVKVNVLSTVSEIRADGPGLKGDSFRLPVVALNGSFRIETGNVSIEQVEILSTIGNLSGSMLRTDGPARLEGTIDLAAIAAQLPHALGMREGMKLDRGTATIDVATTVGKAESEWSIEGKVGLADLAWTVDGTPRDASKTPISLTTRSVYDAGRRSLRVVASELATPYGSAEAKGSLSAKSIDLTGSIAPDWAALTKILADRVEPGAKLAGGPRGFRIKREGDSLDIEAGLSIAGADLFGMKLGATPIVVRSKGGAVTIDPIATTLNEGRLALAPRLDMDAPGGPAIRLGKDSGLTGAVVNEEVSRRVLSYVAPILDRTTRASGRVSMAIEDATFPLIREVGNKAVVTGSVVFQDLQFAPGPLAHQMFSLVSAREPETIRLDEPVFLTMAEGRINQRGLAFPLGDVTQVRLEGWVDFDKNIGLVASLPMTSAMFPNRPMIGDIISGTSVKIPIGGSLSRPQLDKAAFNANLKDFGTSLLTKTAGLGALELLNKLAQPRDPNAPPPPTAAERKAMRIEKQNERRMKRGLPPLPGP